MQLYSIPFLFYYLPLFLGIYYIVPDKNKTLVTIIGSIIFFLLQDGTALWQLFVMLCVIGCVYIIGTELQRRSSRILLTAAIGAMAALLIFFKCYRGGAWLPLGMSFYLFQLAAYLMDVYRKRLDAEKSTASFFAQVLMFPKLLSGPLMQPRSLQAQTSSPKLTLHRFHRGLQELIVGLAMKVLLADRLAGLWNQASVAGYESLSPLFAWAALAGFAMRLYFDFHGYTIMAVGLGKMLGFELPRNFDDPYTARSVSEFFRRWHITLGAWFRDYVYIPLGGNRNGKWRTAGNVLLVWLLTGLWHGIGGNYLLWGLWLGVLIVLEKLWLGKWLKRMGFVANLYTIAVILLSWVPFAVGDWGQMVVYLRQLFGFGSGTFGSAAIMKYLPLLLTGALFLTPLPERLIESIRDQLWFDGILFVLFWLCIFCIATVRQDPFLYFQF